MLETPIDNKNGNLKVAVKSVYRTVGYYNIGDVRITVRGPLNEYKQNIPSGFYTIRELVQYIDSKKAELFISSISLRDNKIKISMESVEAFEFIILGDTLSKILGIDDARLDKGRSYIGDRQVKPFPEALFIHLKQLSTTHNILNGRGSTLLGMVPVGEEEIGQKIEYVFRNPEYKDLVQGVINEYEFSILDEKNNYIYNNGEAFTIVLEIRYSD